MPKILFICALLLAGLTGSAANFLRELPEISAVIPDYTEDLETRLGELPLCPVEGIWQLPDGGATFAIERAEPSTDHSPGSLRMIMVRSPWRSIRPGTVLGHLKPTARPGVYEARIYSALAQRTGLNLPRPFTLKLNDRASMLTFEPFKAPLKVNLFRLLPYMYRRIIEPQKSRPDNLDGAVKIFPPTDSHPLTPVYL